MAAPADRAPLFTLPRIIMSLLLAVAAAGMYVAFTLHDDAPNRRLQPRGITVVSPAIGTLSPRQTEIFVELTPEYTGSLTINDTPVPDDQLDVIEGLNRYAFTPGEGKEIETLPAGRNCAVVSYHLLDDTGAVPTSYKWCFNIS